jgi:hypothetical protein
MALKFVKPKTKRQLPCLVNGHSWGAVSKNYRKLWANYFPFRCKVCNTFTWVACETGAPAEYYGRFSLGDWPEGDTNPTWPDTFPQNQRRFEKDNG